MRTSQRKSVTKLIKEYPYFEDKKTSQLFARFDRAHTRAYFTKNEVVDILRWKSPRPTQHYLKNTENDFRIITEAAFATRHEGLKMHTLTALKGVNYPAASAILMFHNPKRYPVIDIRVWQQMHRLKLVTTNPKGQGFSLDEWLSYLEIMREIASEFSMPVRQIEKRFFDWHRNEQKRDKVKLYRV